MRRWAGRPQVIEAGTEGGKQCAAVFRGCSIYGHPGGILVQRMGRRKGRETTGEEEAEPRQLPEIVASLGMTLKTPLYLCPYLAASPVALFAHSVCPPLDLAIAAGISQELSKVRREVDTLSGLDEPLQRRHFTSREKLEAVDIEHRRQIEAIALLRQQKQEL